MATYAYKWVALQGRQDSVASQAELDALGALGWEAVGIDTIHGRILLKKTTP